MNTFAGRHFQPVRADQRQYSGAMADRISTLLLFGATGDLARRMLLPSLYGLDADGLLPPDLRVVGTARTDLDDAAFRDRARAALQEYLPAGSFQEGIAERFLSRLHYVPLDIKDAVGAAFPENRIFRIDHYLGKETVQNLLALRFANLLFEPLWNAAHIDHVQITVAETIGVEGRGDFYDAAGALRDMVQNHMLQLLSLVAMEPPTNFDAAAVRDEKVKALRALRPITAS